MRRALRPFASLATALTLGVGATDASASSVSSGAGGRIWGVSTGDSDNGPGALPVVSSAAYTSQPPAGVGAISGSASAAVGRLGARADVSVSNAPGYTNPQYSLYGESYAESFANFNDRWTLSDRPLDTPGTLRVTIRFDGAASGSATGATTSTVGQFTLQLLSLDPLGSVLDSKSYVSGPLAVADEEAVLELEFLYGRSVIVNGSLSVEAELLTLLDVDFYSGSGTAAFDQTAELALLEVQDAQGQWTTSYTLATESGGTYPFQVPEPLRLASAAASVGALALVRRSRAARADRAEPGGRASGGTRPSGS